MTIQEQIQTRLDSGMSEEDAFKDLARLEYFRKIHLENLSKKEYDNLLKKKERPLLDWMESQ